MIPEAGFEKPAEIVGWLRPRAGYLVMWDGALQGGSISIYKGSFAGIWECPFLGWGMGTGLWFRGVWTLFWAFLIS